MERSTKTKLLTVEDTFLIEGLGLIVTPPIPVSDYSGTESVSATLRKPSGEEEVVQSKLQIPRVSPPPQVYSYLCLLVGLTKQDVPIGTEIWI
jgi:hypothetical protein